MNGILRLGQVLMQEWEIICLRAGFKDFKMSGIKVSREKFCNLKSQIVNSYLQ
jgi:hypothetical protein